MLGESIAIVLVILGVSIMSMRTGKRGLRTLALPLISVPVAYLITIVLGRLLTVGVLSTVILTVGLVTAILLCALFSRKIPSRKFRAVYLALCLIFSLALFILYLVR